MKWICVFCGSSTAVAKPYVETAHELGLQIGRKGDGLIYGGGEIGLMGAVARGVHEGGGKVVGVMPRPLDLPGITYREADELVITEDLRTRKAVMDERADAFIALPGGFGTLEETIEILTLKQLQLLDKPLVLLDVKGFYDPLIRLFDHFYAEQFAKRDNAGLYHVAYSPALALEHIDHYQRGRLTSKWI